jgi:hypothetical protein
VHDLVAELQETSLLDVGVLVGVELRRDRIARRIERVGEVEPLETAVLERLPGRLRPADGLPEWARRRGPERLVRVAVVGECPVDAHGVRHDLPQHALGRAELRALDRESALRVEEVVHVRRQAERVGELGVHRVRGVEDQEHVGVRTGVGLQELPVIGPRRARDQEQEEPGHGRPVSGREAGESVGSIGIAHGGS